MKKDLMLQAAVDPEFREELTAAQIDQLPEPVQNQDEAISDLIEEEFDAEIVAFCASTCTRGPLTFYCDGSTL